MRAKAQPGHSQSSLAAKRFHLNSNVLRPQQAIDWLGRSRFQTYLEAAEDNPAVLTPESREKVNEAIVRLLREQKRPSRDRVVASLSFGFWKALFAGVYEELWRTTLFRAFPHGSGIRREIANLTGPILHFRNRIAHHEAIFSSDLEARHRQILRLAGIIDPEAERYIAALSRVETLLLELP